VSHFTLNVAKMDTQHHEIVKLPQATLPTKSTTLNSYFVRTIEILKSIIISIAISKDAVKLTIGALMAIAAIFFLLIWGNIPNGLNRSIYQLSGFSGNIELTADDRSQAIVSDYLKTMTQVILADNPQQIKANPAIFRAMTQATLQELDPGRKRYVMMFLQDANLLKKTSNKHPSLLLGASFTGANLQDINLQFANLQGTNLTGADLRGADLRRANLVNANLTKSCYNNLTIFDKKFQPDKLGMREVKNSQKCD
jgi:hypothetical protein